MKGIQQFQRLPIRRQLTVLLLVPGVVVLLLASAVFLGFERWWLREDFAADLGAVAETVAANSTSAVVSHDPAVAREILNSLRARPDVTGAILVLPDESILAKYGNPAGDPVIEAQDRLEFRAKDALLIKPVLFKGKQVATLNLMGDYRAAFAWGSRPAEVLLLGVVLGGAGIAALLAVRLQRIISGPVLRLSHTARLIVEENDFSVRAGEEAEAEFRILAQALNAMLSRIPRQEEAIATTRRKLEALFDSIDGIVWESTPDATQFTFVSHQSERILGYPPDRWLADSTFWQTHLHWEDVEQAVPQRRDLIKTGKRYTCEYRMIAEDQRVVWIRERGSTRFDRDQPVAVQGILLDITAEKAAEARLNQLQDRLRETSRWEGISEVATELVRNVGRLLECVNDSAALLGERLKQIQPEQLARATAALRKQNGNLLAHPTSDANDRNTPKYFGKVSEETALNPLEMLDEIARVKQNIEHLREIVAMQQTYAGAAGGCEHLNPVGLVEDTLRFNSAALDRQGVHVIREYDPDLPGVRVDRHKVLQILTQLLHCSKAAMDAAHITEPRLVVQIAGGPASKVIIKLRDNGAGIAPENLARMFRHGFASHAAGDHSNLHRAAEAAESMGARLTGFSEGIGRGAEFILELPAAEGEEPGAP